MLGPGDVTASIAALMQLRRLASTAETGLRWGGGLIVHGSGRDLMELLALRTIASIAAVMQLRKLSSTAETGMLWGEA